MKLGKMTIQELRREAVRMGADEKKLYGTSKQALICIISGLRNKKEGDHNE